MQDVEERALTIVGLDFGIPAQTNKADSPCAVSCSKHNMAADRAWDIQVNLDVVCRRLVQPVPVLRTEELHLSRAQLRVPGHQELPGGAAPGVRNPFVRPWS